MAKAPKIDKTEPLVEPVVPLPGLAALLIYRASDSVSWPMIVTSVGDAGISGQAFMAGTERGYVENVTLGDGVGQCSYPVKEA